MRIARIAVGLLAGAFVAFPQDASPHRVRFIEVEDGVRLETLDWGGTGRALVLLAGSGLSGHVYHELAPKLTAFARVLAITRRGYGASSQPIAGYDDRRLAEDVVRVLDAIQIAAPVLVGHSMPAGS
jgi:pimeloyl-ACP methyl ester carboxylesterase